MTVRKKLIEVALPLDAINAEAAREKSIRHGHPSTLHLWWARRPLAACRAVLFASLVDDPGNPSTGSGQALSDKEAEAERKRLFGIIEQLVLWENVNDERVLHAARVEIARSVTRTAGVTLPSGELTPAQVREALEKYAPPVLDPFAGGGSIPLEAQRLGLKAYASDLNPVAVLINKALIEIPPKFAGKPPVHPGGAQMELTTEDRRRKTKESELPSSVHHPPSVWKGAAGLAEDVRYYGAWMRAEAEKRIGHLYPKYLPSPSGRGAGGEGETVIAWLWARTVKCPNPACGATMPLVRSFALSTKKGKETWVEPVVNPHPPTPSPIKGEGENQPERWHIPEDLRRKMVEVARQLRKEPTPSEDILWQALRGKQLDGYKFRRQQNVGPFILDFYCSPKRLVIEVDGPIHETQIQADRERQTLLESLGLHFLRLQAAEVERNLPSVLQKIRAALNIPPSPLVGEGPGVGGKIVSFKIKSGKGQPPEGTVNRRGARCIVCDQPVPFDHVRAEGRAGRMGAQLMAIVTEGQRGRNYNPPTPEHEAIARSAQPTWRPDCELPKKHRNFQTPAYGMPNIGDLFTARQLLTLNTFSDLLGEAHEQVKHDARTVGLSDDEAYADATATYLAFAVDKMTTTNSAVCTWQTEPTRLVAAFSRQAIPMIWDYAEANPFSGAAGDYRLGIGSVTEVLERLTPINQGIVRQLDAAATLASSGVCISTDPPYFDNISYADLSDYFYVWLRHNLAKVYPDIFSTVLVPKSQELIAAPNRFDGDKSKAEEYYQTGMEKAFGLIRTNTNPGYPITIFYAFKQSETDLDDDAEIAVASTGWETMLEGLIRGGFSINGTWPMRTELTVALKNTVSALASSIILVCRPRPESASLATRREFVNALKKELPAALTKLMHGGIAPVDLAQATIGPGMAVFSRYAKVLEADGQAMPVRTALQLINQHLDEHLTAEDSELDKDTRFALAWFQQFGHDEGAFGDADVLARAKDTSVAGMVQAGVAHSRAGKVRLLRCEELADDWDPRLDARLTVWECAQQLIRRLNEKGEDGAAALVKQMGGGRSEDARALAYRLYAICERKKWADEALAYNALVVSWPEIEKKAASMDAGAEVEQGRLL